MTGCAWRVSDVCPRPRAYTGVPLLAVACSSVLSLYVLLSSRPDGEMRALLRWQAALQAQPRGVDVVSLGAPNTAAAAAQGAVAVASAMGLQLLCSDSAHGARQTLHAGVVLCACRFSTDGAQLAAAAMDGRVFVRRRADGGWSQPPPLLWCAHATCERVVALDFSADGTKLALCGWKSDVAVYDSSPHPAPEPQASDAARLPRARAEQPPPWQDWRLLSLRPPPACAREEPALLGWCRAAQSSGVLCCALVDGGGDDADAPPPAATTSTPQAGCGGRRRRRLLCTEGATGEPSAAQPPPLTPGEPVRGLCTGIVRGIECDAPEGGGVLVERLCWLDGEGTLRCVDLWSADGFAGGECAGRGALCRTLCRTMHGSVVLRERSRREHGHACPGGRAGEEGEEDEGHTFVLSVVRADGGGAAEVSAACATGAREAVASETPSDAAPRTAGHAPDEAGAEFELLDAAAEALGACALAGDLHRVTGSTCGVSVGEAHLAVLAGRVVQWRARRAAAPWNSLLLPAAATASCLLGTRALLLLLPSAAHTAVAEGVAVASNGHALHAALLASPGAAGQPLPLPCPATHSVALVPDALHSARFAAVASAPPAAGPAAACELRVWLCELGDDCQLAQRTTGALTVLAPWASAAAPTCLACCGSLLLFHSAEAEPNVATWLGCDARAGTFQALPLPGSARPQAACAMLCERFACGAGGKACD